jgi:hypothetical protein
VHGIGRRSYAENQSGRSTLVLGRGRHQLATQEVERCALVRRHPRSVRDASETDLINPEMTENKAQVDTPIPGVSRGRADVVSWEVVASGSVVIPPLSQASDWEEKAQKYYG